MGYGPWGCKESDTTERLSTHRKGEFVHNVMLSSGVQPSYSTYTPFIFSDFFFFSPFPFDCN